MLTPVLGALCLVSSFRVDPAATSVLAESLVLPANTAFSEPDPDAMRRHADGSVSEWQGSLSWYGRLTQGGPLSVRVRLAR